MEVKPGRQRAKIERWSRQLINEQLPEDQRDPEARRAAVLGNLSIRLNPKYIEEGTADLTDRDRNALELNDLAHVQIVDLELFKNALFDTAVDSLSRLKAACLETPVRDVLGQRTAGRTLPGAQLAPWWPWRRSRKSSFETTWVKSCGVSSPESTSS